jgi:tetratricopeptide (TPR) repeat protein
MSRSIHDTRRSERELLKADYADRERYEAELKLVAEKLARKRRIKAQIKGERLGPEDPLPPVEPEFIPILIHDQGKYIHYPAGVEDLRAVMRLLPVGATNGIHSISLSLGAWHQLPDEYGSEADPFTGRRGHQFIPGVFCGEVLGQYSHKSAKIHLFAYTYDPALPDREMWETLVRLRMLSTFVHEVGHHHDFTERLARGRWLGDAEEKAEIYAEKAERDWSRQCVVPYLKSAYPTQLQALERWVEHYGGLRLTLDQLAGDPRTTLQGGKLLIRGVFGDISHNVRDLASDVAEGMELSRIRTRFACNLHYSEYYLEALSVLDRVLSESGDDLEALTLRADIFEHQERYDEARSLAETVIALDESYLDAWKVLADALEGLKDWNRLVEVTTQILARIDAGDPFMRCVAMIQRARANLALAAFEAAGRDIEVLLEITPPSMLKHIEKLRAELSERMSQTA